MRVFNTRPSAALTRRSHIWRVRPNATPSKTRVLVSAAACTCSRYRRTNGRTDEQTDRQTGGTNGFPKRLPKRPDRRRIPLAVTYPTASRRKYLLSPVVNADLLVGDPGHPFFPNTRPSVLRGPIVVFPSFGFHVIIHQRRRR